MSSHNKPPIPNLPKPGPGRSPGIPVPRRRGPAGASTGASPGRAANSPSSPLMDRSLPINQQLLVMQKALVSFEKNVRMKLETLEARVDALQAKHETLVVHNNHQRQVNKQVHQQQTQLREWLKTNIGPNLKVVRTKMGEKFVTRQSLTKAQAETKKEVDHLRTELANLKETVALLSASSTGKPKVASGRTTTSSSVSTPPSAGPTSSNARRTRGSSAEPARARDNLLFSGELSDVFASDADDDDDDDDDDDGGLAVAAMKPSPMVGNQLLQTQGENKVEPGASESVALPASPDSLAFTKPPSAIEALFDSVLDFDESRSPFDDDDDDGVDGGLGALDDDGAVIVGPRADQWSDDDAEVASLRIVPRSNHRLRAWEDMLKKPRRRVNRDSFYTVETLSRANSQALLDTVAAYSSAHNAYAVVSAKIRAVAEKGGRVLCHPLLASLTGEERWRFAVRANDALFVVCPDGGALSQLAFLVLSGVKRILGVDNGCNVPHGALHGYDPHPASESDEVVPSSMSAVAALDYQPPAAGALAASTNPIGQLDDAAFAETFGVAKSPLFGEKMARNLKYGVAYSSHNQAHWKHVCANRERMREYFDLYFFGPQGRKNVGKGQGTAVGSAPDGGPANRRVFVVFSEAVPVFLDRLLESNRTLNDAVILTIPLSAPSHRQAALAAQPQSFFSQFYAKQYKYLGKLFRPLLTHEL